MSTSWTVRELKSDSRAGFTQVSLTKYPSRAAAARALGDYRGPIVKDWQNQTYTRVLRG